MGTTEPRSHISRTRRTPIHIWARKTILGDVGEYAGLVGLYAGLDGEYPGLVGAYPCAPTPPVRHKRPLELETLNCSLRPASHDLSIP